MVDIKEFLSEDEDEVLGDIHEKVCEDLRELIEDYLLAVKDEVDGEGILKGVELIYKDINFSVRLPADREGHLVEAIEKETNARADVPNNMYI